MKSNIKLNKMICMNKTTFGFFCVILLLIIYFIIDKLTIYQTKDDFMKKDECKCECPIIKEVKEDKKEIIVVDRPTQIIDRDDVQQYRRGPEREYTMGRGLPMNIRTRGEPGQYQNIGILKNADVDDDIKPLYGRRTYRGSNLWNYYTLLNDHIQVKLSVMNNNDCLDERGCSEIMNGGTVKINGVDHIATLYPYSDFRYLPY